jgi:hypothetical protein
MLTNLMPSQLTTNSRLLPISWKDEEDDTESILDAAIAILEQGSDLLKSLPSESYTARLPAVFNASIGGHYRHCLDHFASVVRGLDRDVFDYDNRERDRQIETDTAHALSVTEFLSLQLRKLSPGALHLPVRTRCEVSYTHGRSPVSASSLGRELVYAIAHAIHHFALIAVMARLLGIQLPPDFGVAPSTVAHQAKEALSK